MDFKDVVRARRMVRAYRPDPIDEDALERILSAALRGPSAGFSQGIDIVVVTNPEVREKVMGAVEGPRINAPVLVVITADQERYEHAYAKVAKLVVASGREWQWPVPYWFVDAGAAMMLILLAAVDEGLSAGFFGHPQHVPQLRELLGLPANAVPIGVMTIGHDDEEQAESLMFRRARGGRRPMQDAVHREQW